MSYEDREYHRRRSEIEIDKALAADAPESAVAHLELARMHRARRLATIKRAAPAPTGAPILRTDKEA